MKTSVIVTFFLLLGVSIVGAEENFYLTDSKITERKKNILATKTFLTRQNPLPYQPLSKNKQANYQQLLAHNNQDYLWFDNNKLNLSGLSLISLLNDLGIKQLLFPDMVNLVTQQDEVIKKVDQQLTQQLFTIATLFNGYQSKPLEKPQEDIFQAVKNNNLASYVDQLLPQFDQVLHLRSAIAYYRQLAKKPWPVIDKNLSLTLGQGHKEVAKLRNILVALADLNKKPRSRYRQHIFDPEVINALKQFQTRHNLKPNGKLTAKTIAALNTSPAKRITTMQINLWRWLSLPSKPPKRYVMVNIPSYRLSFVDKRQETLSMKVIVGDSQHPTPIMVTQVNSLTINPQWTPTYNIVHNELLVENSTNPGSLKRQNFKLSKGYGAKQIIQPVFNDSASIKAALGEYKLIQVAGKNNALGKYRFNIKNFHSVYLHDTPAKNLFLNKNRALSHGCVRLQSAHLLAQQFMVSESQNKQLQIKQALTTNKSQHIKLKDSIEVYLTYQTVWLTPAGKVHWSADIYQLDQPFFFPSQLNSQMDTIDSNLVLVKPEKTD
ncbi:MAG: L,D-transpeptidase family protein [Colwellia sp.]|nr:L,D-transpeptidase family protein [Colwellia sp.]